MTSRPRCGCCKTGAEYIHRHVDCVGRVPLGVNANLLALAVLEHLEDGYAPAYVPDVQTLTAWIRQAQSEQCQPCCGAA